MAHVYESGYKIGEKGATLGIFSNAVLFAIKLFAGIFGRSQAMIADAFHTASDILTSVGVFVGFRIAGKPADEHHPFGHGRAESIAAKIVSLILILVGLLVAYASAKKLISGDIAEPRYIAAFAAIISIVIKEITYRRVILASKKINSASLKADAYHHRSDVFSSVAALIGILGAKFGNTFMDPLAGVLVAGFIIKMGIESFHVAYDELMDAAPPDGLRWKIENIITGVKGVEELKKIMVRKTGIEFFVEVTIGVDGTKTVEEGHRVTAEIRKTMFDALPGIRDTIVHVEPRGEGD